MSPPQLVDIKARGRITRGKALFERFIYSLFNFSALALGVGGARRRRGLHSVILFARGMSAARSRALQEDSAARSRALQEDSVQSAAFVVSGRGLTHDCLTKMFMLQSLPRFNLPNLYTSRHDDLPTGLGQIRTDMASFTASAPPWSIRPDYS